MGRGAMLAVAGLSFLLFLFGAGVLMALFDLLEFWALTLDAVINLAGMTPICGLTVLPLEVGAISESHRSRTMRVGQRTMKLESGYWVAGGVAIRISSVLLFFSQYYFRKSKRIVLGRIALCSHVWRTRRHRAPSCTRLVCPACECASDGR